MGRGGHSSPARPFFVGAVVLQPASALDRFVAIAQAGNEFVYCEAAEPMYGETWSRAGELAQAGLVRAHHRRRAGGGFQWFVVRTARPLPTATSPQDKALAERATSLIFAQLKREARLGLRCSSDAELARKAGLATRDQAQHRVRTLVEAGLIESTLAYERGVPTRVVTILPSRFAGAAAGKETGLPGRWAAARAAADAAEAAPHANPAAPAAGKVK